MSMPTPLPADYPRMMYHETAAPKTVLNEAAEKALGKDWARKRFPVAAAAAAVSECQFVAAEPVAPHHKPKVLKKKKK